MSLTVRGSPFGDRAVHGEAGYFNDTLHAEVLWLLNTSDGDGLICPKLTCEWQDSVKTWVGADIFSTQYFNLQVKEWRADQLNPQHKTDFPGRL